MCIPGYNGHKKAIKGPNKDGRTDRQTGKTIAPNIKYTNILVAHVVCALVKNKSLLHRDMATFFLLLLKITSPEKA